MPGTVSIGKASSFRLNFLPEDRSTVTENLRSRAVDPQCRHRLGPELACPACGRSYPRLASIAVLLPEPASHMDRWRRQLGLIVQQGRETELALETQALEPATGDAPRSRLQALAGAVGDQVDDMVRVIAPLLGGPLPPSPNTGLPRGVVEYMGCLYRDWAWSGGHHDENARSIAAIRRVIGARELGRTLVLGAGACRLAYDLHRSCGATETAVVDIDPYLLVMAEAVIRGGSVNLTECTPTVQESGHISRRWTLSLPADPLSEDVFHFFLTNGVEPPFEDETFDTVVTPWFIDQVPPDLEAFVATLHRLLVPGGRWINHGPLIHRTDVTPIARRYTREEIFALAHAAGFVMGPWQSESCPYLVSPLTGRGRIEKVFTFEATRPGLISGDRGTL